MTKLEKLMFIADSADAKPEIRDRAKAMIRAMGASDVGPQQQQAQPAVPPPPTVKRSYVEPTMGADTREPTNGILDTIGSYGRAALGGLVRGGTAGFLSQEEMQRSSLEDMNEKRDTGPELRDARDSAQKFVQAKEDHPGVERGFDILGSMVGLPGKAFGLAGRGMARLLPTPEVAGVGGDIARTLVRNGTAALTQPVLAGAAEAAKAPEGQRVARGGEAVLDVLTDPVGIAATVAGSVPSVASRGIRDTRGVTGKYIETLENTRDYRNSPEFKMLPHGQPGIAEISNRGAKSIAEHQASKVDTLNSIFPEARKSLPPEEFSRVDEIAPVHQMWDGTVKRMDANGRPIDEAHAAMIDRIKGLTTREMDVATPVEPPPVQATRVFPEDIDPARANSPAPPPASPSAPPRGPVPGAGRQGPAPRAAAVVGEEGFPEVQEGLPGRPDAPLLTPANRGTYAGPGAVGPGSTAWVDPEAPRFRMPFDKSAGGPPLPVSSVPEPIAWEMPPVERRALPPVEPNRARPAPSGRELVVPEPPHHVPPRYEEPTIDYEVKRQKVPAASANDMHQIAQQMFDEGGYGVHGETNAQNVAARKAAGATIEGMEHMAKNGNRGAAVLRDAAKKYEPLAAELAHENFLVAGDADKKLFQRDPKTGQLSVDKLLLQQRIYDRLNKSMNPSITGGRWDPIIDEMAKIPGPIGEAVMKAKAKVAHEGTKIGFSSVPQALSLMSLQGAKQVGRGLATKIIEPVATGVAPSAPKLATAGVDAHERKKKLQSGHVPIDAKIAAKVYDYLFGEGKP